VKTRENLGIIVMRDYNQLVPIVRIIVIVLFLVKITKQTIF